MKDPHCGKSLPLAQQVVQDVKAGKDRSTVQSNLAASLAKLAAAPPSPAPGAQEDPNKVYKIDTLGSPVRGPKSAKVTIVLFSDYQCPYCARVEPLLKQVLDAYPKQVKLVFKQYPLSFHQNARPAALASLAAMKQGKFWEMHDKIFENQASMADAQGKLRFSEFAKQIGLNVPLFEKTMKDPALEQIIAKDLRDGADAAVTGTPSLYLNGRKVNDRSLEGFKRMIDAELTGAKTASSGGK
ncbi:MAG TPA: thioredoxin domain-containing protein [Candidatus Polarisedimenticolia bacterium]|nr:thioredoxin domain-containing protein [Candidatus Polarisedimenticolia bacterium]